MLRATAEAVSARISLSRQQQPVKHFIAFVKAGEKPQQVTYPTEGLLAPSRDWQLNVDLGSQLKFPDTISVTTLKPNMVLVSQSSRQMLLLQLTVPWEDWMRQAFERKRAKYKELVDEC